MTFLISFTNFDVGAAITRVTASNTNGVMAGYYSTNRWSRGFINKAGVMESFQVELPRVVSTEIRDMNDRGCLVGSYVQINQNNQPVRHGSLAVPTLPQPSPLEMQRVQNQLVFIRHSKASAAMRSGCQRRVHQHFRRNQSLDQLACRRPALLSVDFRVSAARRCAPAASRPDFERAPA